MEIAIDVVISFVGGILTGMSAFLYYLKRKQKKMMEGMSDMMQDLGDTDET